MTTIRHKMLGMNCGNFYPKQTDEVFWENLRRMRELLANDVRGVIAPRVGFTTVIADSAKPSLTPWSGWFARTSELADGCIVRGTKMAVGIFNADCPLLCLYEDEKLCVLHIGYRCLIRQNREEEGIVEVALRNFNPKKVKASVFGGIGPCCWVPEYDDKPEILKPELSRYPSALQGCLSKTMAKSPFGADHISVDLYRLARSLLLQGGIPDVSISMDATCTCCATADGKPVFWSHTRFEARSKKLMAETARLYGLNKLSFSKKPDKEIGHFYCRKLTKLWLGDSICNIDSKSLGITHCQPVGGFQNEAFLFAFRFG